MPAPRPQALLAQRILALLGDGQLRSTAEIAAALDADPVAIRASLTRLRERHDIVRVGFREEALTRGGWERRQKVRHAVWVLAHQPGTAP